MTRVTVVRDLEGQIQQFTISGHANFAEYGKDIVCASISMLSISIINGIEEVVGQKVNYSIDEKKGLLQCSLPVGIEKEKMKMIQVLLETMQINLKELQKQHPKHIKLIEEEV